MAHVTRSFPASRAAFDPPHLLNTAPAAGRGESSSRTRKPCSCDSMDSMDSLLWGLWTGLMKKSAPYAMRSSFATYNKALHGPGPRARARGARGRRRTAARFAPSLDRCPWRWPFACGCGFDPVTPAGVYPPGSGTRFERYENPRSHRQVSGVTTRVCLYRYRLRTANRSINPCINRAKWSPDPPRTSFEQI